MEDISICSAGFVCAKIRAAMPGDKYSAGQKALSDFIFKAGINVFAFTENLLLLSALLNFLKSLKTGKKRTTVLAILLKPFYRFDNAVFIYIV